MKIMKIVLSGILMIYLVLIISGCIVQTNIDANDAKNEVECRLVKGDYSWLGGKCCLDDDYNGKCDLDEVGSKGRCDYECSDYICQEENNKVYYDCVMKADGCKDLEKIGIIIGKCGVECISERDCLSNQRCFNYKCEEDRCGDGVQGTYENCEDCPEDFLKEGLFCCNKQVVKGDCCVDLDCEEDNECKENKCIPLPTCGDGDCNLDETCEDCPEDCLKEGELCCDAVAVSGCCTNEDCTVDQICIDNVCTLVELPVNETEQPESNQTGGNNTE